MGGEAQRVGCLVIAVCRVFRVLGYGYRVEHLHMERVGGGCTSVGIHRGHRVVACGGYEQRVVVVATGPGVRGVVGSGCQCVGVTVAYSGTSRYHRLRRFVHDDLG